MVLPILTYPHPILQKKAEEIDDPKSSEIRELVLDMLETMEKAGNALGLAAPQVGKSVRLCIIKLDGKTHILINPQIKSKFWKKEISEEGCLSFPGKFIPIKRHKKITVRAQDREGNKITIKADGIFSRALQHEIDHLDGILFINRQ
ncbi:MAG: peptide deformylase [Candidatus Moranbacteria bacterium RIFOXYA12_FULL_44_15]|nr:MAG: peptide deformylase [Candidatus Moranbacteria bacterium RIFOXYA12_FULL_44_15]OGI34358.1 MAG: peptide deformylase [Candidatus Moranbacteria bacterium RIFOXYA2_FULL_43_15]